MYFFCINPSSFVFGSYRVGSAYLISMRSQRSTGM